MKQVLAIALCLAIPMAAFSADSGYNVVYDGGSVQDIKTGARLKLHIDGTQISLMKGKQGLVVIPAASVTEISYGKTCIEESGRLSDLRSSHWESARSWR